MQMFDQARMLPRRFPPSPHPLPTGSRVPAAAALGACRLQLMPCRERGNSSVKLASMLCSAPLLALPAWWAPHHDGALTNDTCCACMCRAGGAGGMQGTQHALRWFLHPSHRFHPPALQHRSTGALSMLCRSLQVCVRAGWTRWRGAGRAVNMAWQLQLQHLAISQTKC